MASQDGLLVQLGNQKKLFLSNEILQQEALAPLPLFEAVRARGVDASSPQWRRRMEKETNMEIYESSAGLASGWGAINEFCIVAKLEVKCHLMEVHNALTSDATNVFEAAMRGLHGKRFKRGAVLHTFHTDDVTDTNTTEPTPTDFAVKTATFATGGAIGKDAEFVFVDARQRFPERKSVVHITKSLPTEFHDRLAAKHSMLGGAKEIVACTHAELVSNNKTRLFFFASCTVDDEAARSGNGGGGGFHAMERPSLFLIRLARGLARMDRVVERRRLGYQSFIYRTSKMPQARGTKSCKVCDKSFNVLLRIDPSYCQLCGYRTCASCCASRDVEPKPGVLRANRVCKTCMEGVNHCVFDDDDLELLGATSIADFMVTTGPSFVQQQAESASATTRIVVHKKRPNSQPDDEALKLIEYLFSTDTDKQAIAFSHFGVTPSPDHKKKYTNLGSLCILEGILRHYLAHPTRLGVNDCIYAEPDNTREYLLNFEDGLRIADAPRISQEHVRLDLISRLGLLHDGRFVRDPFDAVCEIAARVMDCRTAYLSVVNADLQHAVAHYNATLLKLPRRETLCAYALTSDRPFIIRNALHDLRFRDFFCVARGGMQFYASFPVDAPSSVGGGGTVAGLVVVDREPKRVITNRQYTRMLVLTRVLTELLGALPVA